MNNRKSNYDKYPSTKIAGDIIIGWNDILVKIEHILEFNSIIAVDFYPGVIEEEIIYNLQSLNTELFCNTRLDVFKSEQEVVELTRRYMTDDELFGYVAPFRMEDFFDEEKLEKIKIAIANNKDGKTIIVGCGASLVVPQSACIIYVDMARWEIIQRFRRHEVSALGVDDRNEPVPIQHKRGYFIDWRVSDRHKDSIFHKAAFWIDAHLRDEPKMIDKETFFKGIEATVARPFRVVPFFDPAPWGGQWMKENFDLDDSSANYGWCFDCVPEENSLLLEVNETLFEMPSVNLVLLKSKQLLGGPVEARFGKEFPIRFDFLDTIGGGSLSLQVHPTTQYIHENFGMFYTQDESYYMVEAAEDASVYLGLKNGIDKDEMISDLLKAQEGKIVFDAEKYSNRIPAKKHDHFLIPGGTVHCSGPQGLVLEISSTPNLFTFKLWDWGRLGLDGKPRPINIERGKDVINWERNTDYVHKHLINVCNTVAEGDGWIEERTGLHTNEFIETRRHRFSKKVIHKTTNSVSVFNLLEGDEVIVESPENKFAPFVVHYAETFIIPAWIGEYTIAPYGKSIGKECVTIKAYVRH